MSNISKSVRGNYFAKSLKVIWRIFDIFISHNIPPVSRTNSKSLN